MFRRGQILLTLALTTVYLGQSLFLGALHYHENHHGPCAHHVHQHDHHHHAGHACSSHEHQPPQSVASIRESLNGKRSLGDSHADCAICQYLSQGALAANIPDQRTPEPIAPLLSSLHSCIVLPSPFSLPRPRSPPGVGNPSVG
jgi:hypothetical protein